MELSKAARIASKAADQGRHIFIYNNIRTNQTVYSLQRTLNNHDALSQLTYAGKKTIPPKLRKDVWRPMAIVTFPDPKQGLSMYHKLRELRKLHEISWDNNKEYPMLPPETQKKIKEGKAAPTKKERAKIIMDQKANTVADLAALLKQYEDGVIRPITGGEGVQQLRTKVRELEAAAEAARNDNRLKEIEKEMAEKQLAMSEPTLNGSTRKPILVVYKSLKRERESLLRAEAELDKQVGLVKLADKAANGDLSKTIRKISDAKQTLATKGGLTEEARAGLEKRVEEGQKEEKAMQKAIESVWKTVNGENASKTPPLRKLVKYMSGDKWSAKGVSIRWADVVDANYAEDWPAKVVHDRLGMTRHSAPDPNAFEQPDDFEDEMEEAETEEAETEKAA